MISSELLPINPFKKVVYQARDWFSKGFKKKESSYFSWALWPKDKNQKDRFGGFALSHIFFLSWSDLDTFCRGARISKITEIRNRSFIIQVAKHSVAKENSNFQFLPKKPKPTHCHWAKNSLKEVFPSLTNFLENIFGIAGDGSNKSVQPCAVNSPDCEQKPEKIFVKKSKPFELNSVVFSFFTVILLKEFNSLK